MCQADPNLTYTAPMPPPSEMPRLIWTPHSRPAEEERKVAQIGTNIDAIATGAAPDFVVRRPAH